MRKVLAWIDIRDVLAIGGLALIGVGLWQFSWPLALIAVGICLLTLAVVSSRKRPNGAPRPPAQPA